MTKQMEIKFVGCNLQKMTAMSKNSIKLDSCSPYNNSNHGTTMQHQRLLDLVVHLVDSILTSIWFNEASPICLGRPFITSGRCLPFLILKRKWVGCMVSVLNIKKRIIPTSLLTFLHFSHLSWSFFCCKRKFHSLGSQ